MLDLTSWFPFPASYTSMRNCSIGKNEIGESRVTVLLIQSTEYSLDASVVANPVVPSMTCTVICVGYSTTLLKLYKV